VADHQVLAGSLDDSHRKLLEFVMVVALLLLGVALQAVILYKLQHLGGGAL